MNEEAKAIERLEKLKALGFSFLTLERYERQVVAERDGFAALIEYKPGGDIRQFSSAGYLIEGQIGMLITRGVESVFVAKQKEVRATPEMLARYRSFQDDLQAALGGSLKM